METPARTRYASANPFAVLDVEACPSSGDDDDFTPHTQDATTFFIRTMDINVRRSTKALVQLENPATLATVTSNALVDCGATGCFLDKFFVRKHRFPTRRLARPIPVYNIDGTRNEQGSVEEMVDLRMRFGDHVERMTFAVCSLGSTDVILGHTWLAQHNPEIDWTTGQVTMSRCPPSCAASRLATAQQHQVRVATPSPLTRPVPPPPSPPCPSTNQLTAVASPPVPQESFAHLKRKRTRSSRARRAAAEDSEQGWVKGDRVFACFLEPEVEWISATATKSQQLAEAAATKEARHWRKWFHPHTTTSGTCFPRSPLTNFRNGDHGTTQLSSSLASSRPRPRSILCLPLSRRNSMHSLHYLGRSS